MNGLHPLQNRNKTRTDAVAGAGPSRVATVSVRPSAAGLQPLLLVWCLVTTPAGAHWACAQSRHGARGRRAGGESDPWAGHALHAWIRVRKPGTRRTADGDRAVRASPCTPLCIFRCFLNHVMAYLDGLFTKNKKRKDRSPPPKRPVSSHVCIRL